jgi:predicted RNA-binding Zn-ribbon protein involved in translation (DUF1610 family)
VTITGYQDGTDRLREMTSSTGQTATERFYQEIVEALADAVVRETTESGGEGWCVLWAHNSMRTTERGEAFLRTVVACDDETGGQRAYRALVGALSACLVPCEAQAHPVALLADSEPIFTRWRDWRLGPQHDSIKADLVPSDDVDGVEVERVEPLPRIRCPGCGADTIPLPLLHGYPSREAELSIALGEAAYGTDCVDGPVREYECPECGTQF